MRNGLRAEQHGYALLIMMILLAMGSMYAIVSRLDAVQTRSRQAQTTGAALMQAKEALIGYAATYRDNHDGAVFGYLPCPDTQGNGIEQPPCGSAGQAAIGLLPSRTLGLPDLRDADGNCLWYAVAGTFKSSPKSADSPMNWDNQGQFTVTAANATPTAPNDANGGAAAIVFAPGAALPGQSRSATNQPCGTDPANVGAYLESAGYSFTQGIVRDAQGMVTHNDQLVWITPRDIFTRIVARADFMNPIGSFPEGQLAKLIAASRQVLDARIWSDIAALTPASTGRPAASAPHAGYDSDYAQFAGKLIGDLPDLKPLAYSGVSYDADFDNWQDQFRLAICDDLKPASGCLGFGAQTCRGALLFGGQAGADAFPFAGPRPTSQKPQTPPPSRSAYLSNYFESGSGLDLLASPTLAIVGASSYADTARHADVIACLSPGAYATFAKDSAALTRVATSAARPEASINAATARLVLGNTAATAAGHGCAWFPIQLPFNSSLRAYFKMRIADLGEGLVFAIADGPANQTAITQGSLCGSDNALLGYAGGSIVPPKFGLEIDTRAQTSGNCNGNNRSDPSANHMAFVYWGSSATAADDNCHSAGTLGSSSQPLNPRTLATAVAAIRTASWATNVATVTTTTAHGLADRQPVTITDVVPAGYNGTYPIALIDATRFAYTAGTDPGPFVSGGSVSPPAGIKNVQSSDPHLPYAGTLPLNTDIHVRLDVGKSFDAILVQSGVWTAATGSVTVTTFSPHGLRSNQRVTISGIIPAAYNGSHRITVVDTRRFSYVLGAAPGNYVSGGRITAPLNVALQSASWAGNAATIITATAHGFVTGQPVSVAGIVPSAYNGTFPVVVVDPTRFSYALGSDPGGYLSGGTLTPAVALELRAYVASALDVFSASYLSTCALSDIQNLSSDLETLCTQKASIEQRNIYMDVDATSGQALATIYAGFTNAQSSGAAGRQNVTISNFAIKTQ